MPGPVAHGAGVGLIDGPSSATDERAATFDAESRRIGRRSRAPGHASRTIDGRAARFDARSRMIDHASRTTGCRAATFHVRSSPIEHPSRGFGHASPAIGPWAAHMRRRASPRRNQVSWAPASVSTLVRPPCTSLEGAGGLEQRPGRPVGRFQNGQVIMLGDSRGAAVLARHDEHVRVFVPRSLDDFARER